MRHLKNSSADQRTRLYEAAYFANMPVGPWHQQSEAAAIGVRSATESLQWVERANEDAFLGALILSGGDNA